ncbi:hypothetical protein ALC56_07550 [Trachymyrmex septentrionalis]|uniref:Uncharacterized protein n=1 Tax=Trachymyrmex septentrionalis TaxID=34720 RepID=A0A151JVT2_9HYME|nr:hypothetical protein ALC56_07550 [Trachymyrmex septentrionalis]
MNFCVDSLLWTKYGSITSHPRRRNSQNNGLHRVIEYIKDEKNVLKLKVPSRHISRATYRCFLRYKPNSIGVSGVTHYVCEYANGRRTIDCCSYIAVIIYYLSYVRNLSKIF